MTRGQYRHNGDGPLSKTFIRWTVAVVALAIVAIIVAAWLVRTLP